MIPIKSFITRAEDFLFRLAQIYNVNRPLIFSPFARRAVCINALEQPAVDHITIDHLRLQHNGLDQILLTDRTLMWNVKIDPLRDMLGYNAVDTFHHCYFYDNVADNQFILPVAAVNQTDLIIEKIVRSTDGALELIANRAFDDESYHKITIVKPALDDLPDGVEIFSNDCDVPRLFKKSHIRTAADINYILSALKQKNFSARFAPNSDKPPIPIYEPQLQYHSGADEIFNRALRQQNSPIIDVEFQGAEPFVADYANFVLHRLGWNFPEYRWRGVH